MAVQTRLARRSMGTRIYFSSFCTPWSRYREFHTRQRAVPAPLAFSLAQRRRYRTNLIGHEVVAEVAAVRDPIMLRNLEVPEKKFADACAMVREGSGGSAVWAHVAAIVMGSIPHNISPLIDFVDEAKKCILGEGLPSIGIFVNGHCQTFFFTLNRIGV